MDNLEYLEFVPSTSSIQSNRVSRIFATQVHLNTSICHRDIVSALLGLGANSYFMDRAFVLKHNIHIKKLPFSTPVTVIDSHPTPSGDILKESEAVRVVLGDLACVIDLNMIHSPKHSIILSFPWFEFHNPKFDWINRVIMEPVTKHPSKFINVSKGIVTMPCSSPHKSEVKLPIKYQEFADVFDKVKANKLP